MKAPRSERFERVIAALTIEGKWGLRSLHEAMERAKVTGEAVPVSFINEKGETETIQIGVVSPRASAIKAFRAKQVQAQDQGPVEESGWNQVKQGLRQIAKGLGL
jgi:hypothetical protein